MIETTTAVKETAGEIKPFVDEQSCEAAYRSSSNPGTATGEISRTAIIVPGTATGRRKEAVTRVRIVPGSGQWTVNGHTLEDYFPNKVHRQLVSDLFAAAGVMDSYDVIARIDGGDVAGQTGALRLGITRAFNEIDTEANHPALKRARMLICNARVKEHKGAGLKKAHKAPQYSKR